MTLSDSPLMKYARIISRLLVGVVFIFSGFVKAIDPSGSAIKFIEYYDAFHIGFLHVTAFPLAILLSSMELMIGINLLLSIRLKFTSWLLIVFMTFFTLLTFVLAIANPVSDCGCFGDAITLTNWETFLKNIIIMAPSLVIFLGRNHYKPWLRSRHESIMAGVGFLVAVLLSVYCIVHLPLIDFRPYRIGTNIPQSMIIPEGEPLDEYETILVYEKDGVQEEFTTDNFPWQDSSWVWVETQQKLIRKGYEPPIHDFSITTGEDIDITETVLSDPGYTLLLISHSLDKANKKFMEQSNDLYLKCSDLDIRFICLTASPESQIREYISESHPEFEICTTDETTLKTIVRANPGLLLLREGTILGKWNFRDAPPVEEMLNEKISESLSQQLKRTELMKTVVFFTGLALFLIGMIALLRGLESRSRDA